MNITHAVLTSYVASEAGWRFDWLWGLPLIVSTVVFHVSGFSLINQRVDSVASDPFVHRHPTSAFMLVIAVATLLASVMHATEAMIWSLAYRFLGALPDAKTAMLYSLNAMTSYGHENLILEAHWRLLGAIEALNGWLLFGLTSAFLFGMIVRVRSTLEPQRHF
jgi:hypothetical protein